MEAAVAYGLNKKVCSLCNFLIFDLGGASFQCLPVDHQGGPRLACHDTHLGGEDFDNCLAAARHSQWHHTYGLDKMVLSMRKVPIFNLGGGTFVIQCLPVNHQGRPLPVTLTGEVRTSITILLPPTVLSSSMALT